MSLEEAELPADEEQATNDEDDEEHRAVLQGGSRRSKGTRLQSGQQQPKKERQLKRVQDIVLLSPPPPQACANAAAKAVKMKVDGVRVSCGRWLSPGGEVSTSPALHNVVQPSSVSPSPTQSSLEEQEEEQEEQESSDDEGGLEGAGHMRRGLEAVALQPTPSPPHPPRHCQQHRLLSSSDQGVISEIMLQAPQQTSQQTSPCGPTTTTTADAAAATAAAGEDTAGSSVPRQVAVISYGSLLTTGQYPSSVNGHKIPSQEGGVVVEGDKPTPPAFFRQMATLGPGQGLQAPLDIAFVLDSVGSGADHHGLQMYLSALHIPTGALLCQFQLPRSCHLSANAMRLVPYGPGRTGGGHGGGQSALLVLSGVNNLLCWPVGCGEEPEDEEEAERRRVKEEEAALKKKKKKVTVVHDNKNTRTNTGRGGKASR
jgi:hypothetical protein